MPVWQLAAVNASAAHSLTGHAGEVSGVAFGPGGRLATAGANGAVTVWNTAGARPGRPVRDWIILVGAVLALALAAAAVAITTREIWPRNFGRT